MSNKHDSKNEPQISTHKELSSDHSLVVEYAKIACIVALYWFISITMVFLNKKILSGTEFKIDAPLFVTWFQCLFSLAITGSLSVLANSNTVGNLFKSPEISDKIKYTSLNNNESYVKKFSLPAIHFRIKIIRQILPRSIVFVAMISFNNLCLKNVGVAFYFVGRSLTTVFNVALTFFLLGRKTSTKAIACCLAIICGFFMGVDQEQFIGTLSVSGVIYGVLASLFVSLNSIFIAKALLVVDNSIWLLTFYNNLIACVLFIPLMAITGEFAQLGSSIWSTVSTSTMISFWSLMCISGLFGFLIGYVTNLQIKYTSPLTHNISGTAKACAQTVLATYLYNETKTFSWWLSNVIVLSASAAYTRVKQQEMKSQHKHADKNQQNNQIEIKRVHKPKMESV